MDHWTPDMRNAFIDEAINSDKQRGTKGPYGFKVFPKVEDVSNHEEDPRRASVTDVMSSTLYMPKYKKIVMRVYMDLCHKLATHTYIGHEFNRNFVVMLKGGNAHIYLAEMYRIKDDVFKSSDTDICVAINPFLPVDMFDYIKQQVEIVGKQVFSQYKRSLDHQLFLHRPLENDMMDSGVIADFMSDFNKNLSNLSGSYDNTIFSSPFESDEMRNKCSRNSFLIVNSKGREDSVVRVEVPHFERCERIPLRKTPLFCSFNETIDFKRDGIEKVGKFNLYRLKLNVLAQTFDQEGEIDKEDRIPADLVDMSVPDITDAELINFWMHGRSLNVFDKDIGVWVSIPDIITVISELKRILEEYESCDSKKEKRMRKLLLFQNAL